MMELTLLRPLDLLRNPFKLRTFFSPPIRSVLRWTRLTRKPSKLTKKTSIRRITAGSFLAKQPSRLHFKLPPPPPRKRIRARTPQSMLKRKPLPRVRTVPVRALKQEQAQVQPPATPTRPRTCHVPVTPLVNHLVSLSVNDLHKATTRAFRASAFGGDEKLTFQDKLFMEQLTRASTKHTLFSGVTDVQTQIQHIDPEQKRRDALEHELVAQRLRVEREAREEAERKMIEERKVIMAKNVLAARARDTAGMSQEPTIERELGWSEIAPQHDRAFLLDPVNARKAHDRWTVYELRWNAFLGQDIPPALSFTDLPWPTINDYTITYEEVELFVLSWARPGYQALDWKQRIDKEMDRWSVYESKVLPFVKDGHRTKSRLWVAFARRYLEDMSQKWGDGLAAVATC